MLKRPRRLRSTPAIRSLVRETRLNPSELILPLFILPGTGIRREVTSMPEVYQTSIDEAVRDAVEARELGLGGVILFGIPEEKDAEGSGAWEENGVVQEAVHAIKREVPDLLVITDVCLCEYTDHGHCGLLHGETILNDESLELYTRVALSHAKAGADIVAPSDMMDGRVGAIRAGLDEAGYSGVPIMSYAVKYASSFYGPFRDAADSSPSFGDRRSHQMDPANIREALREAALDEEEGADILMVKPALPNLDVIARVAEKTHLPIAAYQVSGEYAMLHASAERGWTDLQGTMEESLLAIRRAGASIIITYFARRFARGFVRE